MQPTLRALALPILLAASCLPDFERPPSPGDAAPPGEEPPPEQPPPPEIPPVYRRGSLVPPYRLLPRAEYGRIQERGVSFSDADLQTSAVLVSAEAKLEEISAQIGAERGTAVSIITDAADRQRAALIPFRGNPSDVAIVRGFGATKLYVPLGGDLMTPGNEVAIVSDDGAVAEVRARVRVGVRPQRLAVHPAGLVFVCNQYSNYVSILDARRDAPLLDEAGQPVEIKTEYFCGDLAFVPKNRSRPDADEQYLWVANRWRGSVLVYEVAIVRDPISDRPVGVRQLGPTGVAGDHLPIAEIGGVGKNPWRLAVSPARDVVFVANNRGGEVARIDVASTAVTRRIGVNAPSLDVVPVADLLYVPSLMPNRGLLDASQPAPAAVGGAPVRLPGLDGELREAHPGPVFDQTRSYNFEDVRNGLFQVDARLEGAPVYYSDDSAGEPNFVGAQRLLGGALPEAAVASADETRLYVALGGSDRVQEIEVVTARRPFTLAPTGRTFATRERPFALALDEAGGRLYVASWGGEVLEVFELGSGRRLAEVDLGYAEPRYPATAVERGEYFFYDAAWSNNGDKSCASCHTDELVTDGLGYSNGATAPTGLHQVKPNHDLSSTDAYFWNGSFLSGSYDSLAVAAQTRTNCEVILFGLVEGPASDPALRAGDPANAFTDGADAECRPLAGGAGELPPNLDAILARVAAQKAVAAERILAATGRPREEVARDVDFYSVAEARLPPNPLRQLDDGGELGPTVSDAIRRGRELFQGAAGCARCHDPTNPRAPFSDGLNHGTGADWLERFVTTYAADPRIVDVLGGLPQAMAEAVRGSLPDRDLNVHHDPVDSFTPFCFDLASCLVFEDPLAARGDRIEESRRLDLLVRFNLADPDRGFVPGNVRGRTITNTPSLRGVWQLPGLLHHARAHGVAEAILAPGHPALGAGEQGFAVDRAGAFDGHGATSALTAEDVAALRLYVLSIE